jgi:hypothetical protein
MAAHAELTPSEAADRLAVLELFDAYAHCADRRDAEEGDRRGDQRFAPVLLPRRRPVPGQGQLAGIGSSLETSPLAPSELPRIEPKRLTRSGLRIVSTTSITSPMPSQMSATQGAHLMIPV